MLSLQLQFGVVCCFHYTISIQIRYHTQLSGSIILKHTIILIRRMSDPPEQTDADNNIKEEPTVVEVNENAGEKSNKPSDTSTSTADGTNNNDVDIDESKASTTRAAPQSQQPQSEEAAPREESDGDFEDCKLTPVDFQNQRQNLKDVLMAKSAAVPPIFSDEPSSTANSSNDDHQQQSALHQDEYSQYNGGQQQYNPHNHESALELGQKMASTTTTANNNNTQRSFKQRKKNRLIPTEGGKKKKGHSHPRKTPYKSEIGRLRHAQQLEREKQRGENGTGTAAAAVPDDISSSASSRSISIKETTAPPDSAFFSIQSAKFKHSILHSLGEFLTGAFADDEEASGSYFSNDLLDQLSISNPHLKGVWLQAKNLNDGHVKQLCEALVRNKVVTEVWLPSNQITDVGAGYIAHMLKFNKSIKELFLGGNDIGPKGAAALASALARGNTTLIALGLGDNHIGVEGAGAFAAALRHNHSLHTLDIKKNGIPKKSSIRGLLNKMLEFNASDPGDESLVLGLQEELANLVASLPPDMAESVVLQAEEALKNAMLCRKRGDKIGAAEAEGVFIRICTTGEAPQDPPEENGDAEQSNKKPMEPDDDVNVNGANEELASLKVNNDAGESSQPEEEVLAEEGSAKNDERQQESEKEEGNKEITPSDDGENSSAKE